MQIINSTWCVPDGDELMKHKVSEASKTYIDGNRANPNNIDLYYEHQIRHVALNETTEFGTFIDVGANIGIWSRSLAKTFKKVHAFEPVEANLECLNKNIKGVDNIEVHNNALSDRNGHANLWLGNISNCGNCTITYKQAYKKKAFTPEDLVPVRTLDSYKFDSVGLIKIDTQGHEWPILQGSIETLKRNKPTVVFEINIYKDYCCDLLESLGAKRITLISKCLMLYSWR